ncbi:MAG: protein kinase domain-containing protein [Terracidiphilus sp.]
MVGRTLSHYRIDAAIGKGGMGEVYRATDTRLGREVAVKVLPEAFARDAERMARFQREAQLLAALNHPHIASIYGLEEADGVRALVMELVEGPTLAERIAQGPIAPGEALPIARQVAEALEYAHERGIVHRDLKPANIKITREGVVKVLDFGLAKALRPEELSGDISNSPTLSVAMTQEGLILGTAAYMAPEQAKARPVDRRADIWAFGCVLYEMLSGRRAFDGETTSDILAAVLRSEPEWSTLPAATPVAIQRLLCRCLVKDPKQRLRDIGDARIAIEETLSGADAAAAIGDGRGVDGKRSSPLQRYLPWALGAAAILFAAIAAWLALQPRPQQAVVRFPIASPENMTFFYGGEASISPDNHYLAFVASPGLDKPRTLWVRPLDSLTATPISGTDGAYLPFWSPDSQQIGFFTGGKLEKVAVSGGTPQVLCDADGYGATWNRNGVILFSDRRSLYSVPDSGGTPTLVVAPDAARKEVGDSAPQFLPDGRHFIFQVSKSGSTDSFIAAGSLDSKKVEQLAQLGSDAIYAPPGYLLYLDQGTLVARPFNARALRFSGPAVPVAQNVGEVHHPNYAYFSVSPAGILAYQTGSNIVQNTPGQMTWFSRAGKKLGTVGQPDVYSTPALSPSGSELAVAKGEFEKQDIWVYDLKRGTASRLTFSPADNGNPAWSADGSAIFFSSARSSGQNGQYGIYQKPADGLGSTQLVFQTQALPAYLNGLSADGRYAIYDTGAGTTQLSALPLFGGRKPFIFIQGNFEATSAQFSPNGHYVAYTSTETGSQQVYVQTFPQHTGKWQVSVSDGTQPAWSRDGKELFYLSTGDNDSETQLMAVAVNTSAAAFQAGIPKQLFETQLVPLWLWRNSYVPSSDGQRFLMLAPASEASQSKPQPINVVVNWPALVKK